MPVNARHETNGKRFLREYCIVGSVWKMRITDGLGCDTTKFSVVQCDLCAAFRAVVPAVPASSHLRRLAPSGLVTAACALRLQSQHVRLPRSDIASSAVARVQKAVCRWEVPEVGYITPYPASSDRACALLAL